MIRPKFTFKKETRKISTLKKHRLVDEMGYFQADDLYISELQALQIKKAPIVTEDGYYLTLPDYIEAMEIIGVDTIEVWVIEEATISDLLRIINFEARPWYRTSKSMLYKAIKTLEQHLWNTTEGRTWLASLPGKDINDSIGYLVGYSGSTVSNVKAIGNKDYTLLDRMDDPDQNMTITMAQQILKANEEMNKKKDNYADVFDSDIEVEEDSKDDEQDTDGDSPGEELDEPADGKSRVVASGAGSKRKEKEKCDAVLKSFSVSFGKYGDYSLDMSSETPVMLLNGRAVGTVNVTATDSNNVNEALHFIMQNADEGWSFHVNATRINKLLKKEEVCSNME